MFVMVCWLVATHAHTSINFYLRFNGFWIIFTCVCVRLFFFVLKRFFVSWCLVSISVRIHGYYVYWFRFFPFVSSLVVGPLFVVVVMIEIIISSGCHLGEIETKSDGMKTHGLFKCVKHWPFDAITIHAEEKKTTSIDSCSRRRMLLFGSKRMFLPLHIHRQRRFLLFDESYKIYRCPYTLPSCDCCRRTLK